MLWRLAFLLFIAACSPSAPATVPSSPSASSVSVPIPSTPAPTAGPIVDRADLDGDGLADEVSLVGAGTLRADLGRGGSLELALADARDPEVVLIGDVDADGRDDLFVRTSRGASTEFLNIVALDRGRLVFVTESGRADPFPIALSGSSSHGDGADCRFPVGAPAELVLLSFRAFESPGLTESVYVWRGKTLALREVRTAAFSEDARSAPEFSRYYTLACSPRSALR